MSLPKKTGGGVSSTGEVLVGASGAFGVGPLRTGASTGRSVSRSIWTGGAPPSANAKLPLSMTTSAPASTVLALVMTPIVEIRESLPFMVFSLSDEVRGACAGPMSHGLDPQGFERGGPLARTPAGLTSLNF